jgi:predicted NUDIX family NTP pyrophosphohydrolase
MKASAGILLHRRVDSGVEFLLVHPGGPFWAKKDEHAWSMPKGEIDEEEEMEDVEEAEEIEETARREFQEETGMEFRGQLTALPPVRTSGKIIHAFLGEGDFDSSTLVSNVFEMEWPPRSGRMQSFPEVDRAAWFDAATAKTKIHKGQVKILELAQAFLSK